MVSIEEIAMDVERQGFFDGEWQKKGSTNTSVFNHELKSVWKKDYYLYNMTYKVIEANKAEIKVYSSELLITYFKKNI